MTKSKIRKPVFGVLGLTVAAAVTLTGCGGAQGNSSNAQSNGSGGSQPGGQSSGQKLTLNVFVGKDTGFAQQQQQMLNQFAKDFEQQNPNVTINYSFYSSSSEENTTLQTSLTSNQGPDIFEFGSTFIPTAYATNGFHVFSGQDWTAIGGQSKFFPSALSMSGPSPNQLIGVPETVAPYGMLVNTKLMQAAGITSPPTTWQQFVTDAQKMTNPSKNQWGTAMDPADSFDPWHICWVLAKDAGGDFVSANGKNATMNSSQVVQAMQFWFDWMTKYQIASPSDVTNKGVDDLHQFENGKIGMLVMQSSNDIVGLNNSQVKNNYTYVPMPTIPYGQSSIPQGGKAVGSFVSGQYLSVPKYVTGAKYQAALKFINFLTSPAQQTQFYTQISTQPANMNVWKSDKDLETPLMKAFYQGEQNSVATPFSGAWGNVEVIFGGAANKIATEIATKQYKSGDIQSVLAAANSQVQSALQQ